jgi:hypothetical protein
MWWLKAVLIVRLLGYGSILALIYFSQTAMLFPTGAVAGATPLPEANRLTLATSEGDRLHGVHLPGTGSGPLILVFPGNAWNAEAAADYARTILPGRDVVAFHYRGYAPSTGRPSAAALQADALLIHDDLVRRFPGRPIVAVGFSIGSGVAAHLAGRRPLAGAILVTPFDSLARVASGHYPWLPVRLLFRHEMEPARDLRGSRTPVVVIAGERDTLIPPARADALASATPNLLFARTVPGAGHNDIYDNPLFRRAVLEAVARIGEH